MGKFIVEVSYTRADGALIERFVIRSRVTGMAHLRTFDNRNEAQYWCDTLNQAHDDEHRDKGQTT